MRFVNRKYQENDIFLSIFFEIFPFIEKEKERKSAPSL